MQKVLSLLMAFVLLEVQAHALSGGPVYGGAQGINVIGTYAGVLVPEDVPAGTGVIARSSTSIGLFSLGVPEAGPATGGVVMFVEGTSFNGNLTGVADPGDGSFSAIIDAVSSYTIVDVIDQNQDGILDGEIETNVFAQGNIDAQIVQLLNTTASLFTTPGATRIAGSAAVDVFYLIDEVTGQPIINSTATYSIDGFKQSDTVSQASFTFAEFDFGDFNEFDNDDDDDDNADGDENVPDPVNNL